MADNLALGTITRCGPRERNHECGWYITDHANVKRWSYYGTKIHWIFKNNCKYKIPQGQTKPML